MSTPETICTDLQDRLYRYHVRYGMQPDKLPLTLDEWAWLSEWCAYAKALARGAAPLLNVPKEFMGVRLQLVSAILPQDDGSVKVKL